MVLGLAKLQVSSVLDFVFSEVKPKKHNKCTGVNLNKITFPHT